MVDERTRERIQHAAKVCETLKPAGCYAMVVAIESAAIDAHCCDLHRLLAIQKVCSNVAEDLMNMYLEAKRDATRN